ncbi:MAG TPA: Hsp20/alpha crystallin family protein [Bacteroidetes bacterium]|nr:Hsp20/alpha crystallin family protein [Bacteroidota bacterium]
MLRANIKNRTFDWMGERYAPIIDPHHFLGRDLLNPVWGKTKRQPPVNIRKDNKVFEMEIAVPGYTKDDLEIIIKDDILIVKGENKMADFSPGAEYVLREFDTETFERQFVLAKGIGHENIKAECKNGILKLTFYDVPAEEEKWFKKVEVV